MRKHYLNALNDGNRIWRVTVDLVTLYFKNLRPKDERFLNSMFIFGLERVIGFTPLIRPNSYRSGWILSIFSTNDHWLNNVCRVYWLLNLTHIFKDIQLIICNKNLKYSTSRHVSSTARTALDGFFPYCAQIIIIGFTSSARLSVRPSRIPCPLCNSYRSVWILSILGTDGHYFKMAFGADWSWIMSYIFKVIQQHNFAEKKKPWILSILGINDRWHERVCRA